MHAVRGNSIAVRLMRPVVAIAALAAIAAAPSLASAAFSTPVDVSLPGGTAFAPQIAVAPDGQTTIVWRRFDGSNSIIQAATRPAGSSTFSVPVNLSAPGGDATAPQVAVAPDGQTTVTWYRYDGANYIVQQATRPAGSSTFAAPVDLSAPGQDAYSPEVAVGPDGETTIAWYRSDGTNQFVQAATRSAGSSTFAPAVNLSAPGQDATLPRLAYGPDGQTTVAWQRWDGSNLIVQQSTRAAGSSIFSAPMDVSDPGQDAFRAQVAFGPEGQTTITWQAAAGFADAIREATRAPGASTFSAQVDLSLPGDDSQFPQIAVAPDGQTTIVWRGSDGTHHIAREATRAAGASAFSAAVDLSATGQEANGTQVAAGPDGQTTVTWSRSDGSNEIVQEATRPTGSSTFSAPADVSVAGQPAVDPQIAVGPDGRETITWYRSNGSENIIQASTGPPTMAMLSVSLAGRGTGSVTSAPAGISCGATCARYFRIGTDVVLSASPGAGSVFTGWSGGGCTGDSATCTVRVSDTTSVGASFGVSQADTPTVAVTRTVRTVRRATITLRSSVAVNGAGRVTQTAVRRGGPKQTLCTTSRVTTAAGTFALTCTMGRSVINELHRHAISYSLVTTYTDMAGAEARTVSTVMTLPRIRVRPGAVTG